MEIEIHLQGLWKSCGLLVRTGQDATLRGGVSVRYDTDYALEHLGARDYRALTVRAPVDLGIRRLPCWPSFLVDLLPQGAARARLERGAAGPLPPWELLERGAINPVGNLRVRPMTATAIRPREYPGFALEEMARRGDTFVDYALELGAAVAGATDTQGDAPKFWIARDEAGRWHPDSGNVPLPLQTHALLKFPVPEAGPRAADILRHEAIYQRIARHFGLRATSQLPEYLPEGALFVPRFDRRIVGGREIRLGVESLYAITGVIDSSAAPIRHDQVLVALAGCVTDFPAEFREYVRRDLFNLALGNRDNHGRNSAVLKDTDGRMALAPLFDFGPSFLDARNIARVIRWDGEDPGGTGWRRIVQQLAIRFEEAGMPGAAEPLCRIIGEMLPMLEQLPQVMRACGTSEDIVSHREPEIDRLCGALGEALR